MVDIEIVYLRKMGKNKVQCFANVVLWAKDNNHIRLMSFLSDVKIGSYFLFLLVDVFCLGVVDIFKKKLLSRLYTFVYLW